MRNRSTSFPVWFQMATLVFFFFFFCYNEVSFNSCHEIKEYEDLVIMRTPTRSFTTCSTSLSWVLFATLCMVSFPTGNVRTGFFLTLSYPLECESQYNRTRNPLPSSNNQKHNSGKPLSVCVPSTSFLTKNILLQLERTVCLFESRGQTRIPAPIFLSFSLPQERYEEIKMIKSSKCVCTA